MVYAKNERLRVGQLVIVKGKLGKVEHVGRLTNEYGGTYIAGEYGVEIEFENGYCQWEFQEQVTILEEMSFDDIRATIARMA